MTSGWLSLASDLTGLASGIITLGFGAAKASTRLGFSVARRIVGIISIPLLTTSLDRLESISLLPILLGESIASTSLSAASTSLNTIANLWQASDEASFSLASFVTIVRDEWVEHNTAGQSVTAVARAVAAWAAIQGFTRQWSEERWMKSTKELTVDDLKLSSKPTKAPARPLPKRTISKVNVTDDILTPGRVSQIISADIGEKDATSEESLVTSLSSAGVSPAPFRSNYDTWKNLRRFSKMVLAGYGGAGLLFFGTPLHPEPKTSKQPKRPEAPNPTDMEVKHSEEDILVHVVEGAEAESMSPPLRHVPFPIVPSEPMSKVSPDQHKSSIHDADEYGLTKASSSYSWWNVLLGKHDRDIFEGFAFADVDESDVGTVRSPVSSSTASSSPVQSTYLPPLSTRSSSITSGLPSPTLENLNAKLEAKRPTAIIGAMQHMPRFWVLTDHGRRQVVVIVRGTMSFNELAADLTCEPEDFEPATASSPAVAKHSRSRQSSVASDTLDSNDIMTSRAFTAIESSSNSTAHFSGLPHGHRSKEHCPEGRSEMRSPGLEQDTSPYQVHGGMLQLARIMGSKGKPVYNAVSAALSRNRGYELVLCGHSLGAGVASLMALMWADPRTCRTVASSGLPVNRRVSVYCFAPPCITSASLSRLCKNLITSIVYSYDVVSRLSLGSVRDLSKAAFWLCEAKGEESSVSLLHRALRGKLGFGGPLVASDTENEKKWFTAVRKTLEANMSFADLFPPGRVWWVVRNEALHPLHQSFQVIGKGLRLFEVQEVETVFRQIEFKGDMLSSHLPHQYVHMLTELEC